jgi:hypothetical protein
MKKGMVSNSLPSFELSFEAATQWALPKRTEVHFLQRKMSFSRHIPTN